MFYQCIIINKIVINFLLKLFTLFLKTLYADQTNPQFT